MRDRGLPIGAINPNLFQDQDYRLGSLSHPDARERRKALAHLLECVAIASELASTAVGAGWRTAPTTRARTACAGAAPAFRPRFRSSTRMPAAPELLVEYKFYEPAFYTTDIPDWGLALLVCEQSRRGGRACRRFWSPRAGRQRRADRRVLGRKERLGGFHFNG